MWKTSLEHNKDLLLHLEKCTRHLFPQSSWHAPIATRDDVLQTLHQNNFIVTVPWRIDGKQQWFKGVITPKCLSANHEFTIKYDDGDISHYQLFNLRRMMLVSAYNPVTKQRAYPLENGKWDLIFVFRSVHQKMNLFPLIQEILSAQNYSLK